MVMNLKAIKRYEISESVEAMSSALFDIPYNAYDTSVEVMEMQKALGRLKERVRKKEDELCILIANEKDLNGKFVYANQSVRDAEMRLRLDKDRDYQGIRLDIDELACDIGKMKEQSNAYGLMFSTIKNEVFHRRRILELDAKRELSVSEAKVIKGE